MAQGRWLSNEERQKIIDLRAQGVSVTAISLELKRSTNFIYRILKKARESSEGVQATAAKKQKTSDSSEATEPLQPMEISAGGVVDASATLSVDGVEVSCEPISFLQESVQPGVVTTSVGIATAEPVINAVSKPACHPVPEPAPQPADTVTHKEMDKSTQAQVANTPAQPSSPKVFNASSNAAPSMWSALSTLVLSDKAHTSQPLECSTATDQASTVDALLKRIQDEIHRLEAVSKSDVYDAQLLQVLVKFQAEMRLLLLQKTQAKAAEDEKRAKVVDTGCMKETDTLLREKLAMEIALLNVQADREKLELQREQIKHHMASILCRKQLQGADVSPTDVDRLFPHLN